MLKRLMENVGGGEFLIDQSVPIHVPHSILRIRVLIRYIIHTC